MSIRYATLFGTALALAPSLVSAQIHAMVNYETKSAESLKVLKTPIAAPARKEGIAIIDVDRNRRPSGRSSRISSCPAISSPTTFSTTGTRPRPTSPRSASPSCA